jgi:hypothetical protein
MIGSERKCARIIQEIAMIDATTPMEWDATRVLM